VTATTRAAPAAARSPTTCASVIFANKRARVVHHPRGVVGVTPVELAAALQLRRLRRAARRRNAVISAVEHAR